MKLKVLSYCETEDYHYCEDEDGRRHRVDIMVDGKLKGSAKDQIGTTVECETLNTYVEIANGVTPN